MKCYENQPPYTIWRSFLHQNLKYRGGVRHVGQGACYGCHLVVSPRRCRWGVFVLNWLACNALPQGLYPTLPRVLVAGREA